MALTNLNKLFVRVTEAGLRDAVIAKSGTDNKIYFLTTTHEIITHGVAYGLSTDVQAQIANIKSILKSFDNNGHGTEDQVKTAVDAVQTALNDYKTENDAKRALLIKTVAYNAANKTIDFTSENGTTVQTIKASDIIGNHLVKSSSYDSATNKLTLVFEGAENDVPVYIDLSSLYDFNDITTDDKVHFKVEYTPAVKDELGNVTNGGSLVISPKIINVANAKAAVEGENATPAVTGLVDALDVKNYIDAAVSGARDTLQAAITKEISDRKAADQALYGGSIPETDAATISGNATHIAALTDTLAAEKTAREAADTAEQTARVAAIKEITDALADPATFWEDYTA